VLLPAERTLQQGRDFSVVRDPLGQRAGALLDKPSLGAAEGHIEQRANVLLEPVRGIGHELLIA
jgi:hypothetical protein